MKLVDRCPKCGLEMQERIIDPIFQTKEYYCVVCEQARKMSLVKHEERKLQTMILTEIQRLWDFRLNEKENYDRFCKYSKMKISYKKYKQIIQTKWNVEPRFS